MAKVRYERGRYAFEYFTIPGRILVLTAVILAVAGPWLVFMWLYDSLTPGRYPLWFFALPIWVILAFTVALAIAVLRWFGVPVIRQPDNWKNGRKVVDE